MASSEAECRVLPGTDFTSPSLGPARSPPEVGAWSVSQWSIVNNVVRHALRIGALLLLAAVAGVVGLAYWFGRGDLRGAARASMKNDLRNLAVAESVYFGRAGTYTATLGALEVNGSRGFVAGEGIELIVGRADSTGWEARAYNAHTSQTCMFSSAAVTVFCH